MYHHILVAGFSIPYLELSAIYGACFLFFTINGATSFSIDAWLTGILQKQISPEQQKSKHQKDLAKLYQAAAADKRDSDNKELETSVR
jgi:putative oxidoreductase